MARPKNERDWMMALDEGAIVCRDTSIHHAWVYSGAARVKGGYERRLLCERCTAVKVQKLDARGFLSSTSMIYPDGYLRPAGSGYASKEDNARIRLAGLTRATRNGLRAVE